MRPHTEGAGRTVAEKLHTLDKELREAGATTLVVSELDQVCWLLNVRGWGDTPNTPISFGFVLDPLTGVMAAMVTFVGLLIFIYSAGYM